MNMCSRYTVYSDNDNSLMRLFLSKAGFDSEISEIYPSCTAPIIHAIGDKICAKKGIWGFKGYSSRLIFNARVETVTVKDLFSSDFENRRCVIPASAFYEWDHKSGTDGKKQLYRFNIPSSDILYFCGFYKLTEGVKHFVILTTEANSDMCDIHTRMPVIIPHAMVREYLTNDQYCYDIACSAPPELVRVQISADNSQKNTENAPKGIDKSE